MAPGYMKTREVPVVPIHAPSLQEAGVLLYIQREDLVHPFISGNKWYKLKYNLQKAQAEGHTTLLTFGGAYSNHIYATAAAGREFGFKTVGIIRGERTEPLNYTLRFAESCGMMLHYISRDRYRYRENPTFLDHLQEQFGRFYLLPEGGTNMLAVKGCMEIVRYSADFDYVCTAVGTGGTLAGMVAGMKGTGQLLGFSSLKNGAFLMDNIHQLTQEYCGKTFHDFQIIGSYHFGGYAKFKPGLIEFINHFAGTHAIPLDHVYTGKMLFGIFDLVSQGYFPKGSRILAIHSGGLQGIYGFNERYGEKFLYFSRGGFA